MSLTIKQPYFPENETKIKFETYRFYLQCICEYLHQEYDSWTNFGERCLEATKRLREMPCFDDGWIKRFMKIAWNTEYLLSMGSDDPELMRINNQWTPIQSYYTVYACSEALAYVLDGQKADSHHKALRKVTAYFLRSGLSPWNKAFQGARGKTRNGHFPVNFSSQLVIPSNLARHDVTPLQMIAKCLKAEHSHRIDDLWGGRKSGIYKYRFDPGYTGLLHFLYRLRIKSNYKEVDIFISEAPEENIRSFSRSIESFCFWTLLYMELILIRKCTKRYVISLAEDHPRLNSRADRLQKRVEFYQNNV
ncbi:hypothetical protein KA005_17340 [bacterium]|nr:hypothetical protein [bacterium]